MKFNEYLFGTGYEYDGNVLVACAKQILIKLSFNEIKTIKLTKLRNTSYS